MAGLSNLLAIVAPKKFKKGGIAATGTFNPAQANQVLTLPQYRDHLDDIFDTRAASDSRALMQQLFKFDPDVSATVNSYLTLANTEPLIVARDLDDIIDRDATKAAMQVVKRLTHTFDYTMGFQLKSSLEILCEQLRYVALMRGAASAELVLDKTLAPDTLRIIDPSSLKWYEKKPNEYKPVQLTSGSSVEVSLDFPTFFISYFRRDPTSIYAYSPFVAAINTIAARQQVVNDLYRIMKITGFPRMDITILEEVVTKAAPADIRSDKDKLRQWLADRMSEVRSVFTSLRADQAIVHFDSVEAKILNEKNPAAGIDISHVIDVLNGQNQAGLKTMSTVIGRGESGVNTSTVEARIAAMNADELNAPIAHLLSNILSFALHQQGFQGFVEVWFENAELRPDTELEPQRLIKTQRLRQDLSDGLITDDEYHLWVYRRLRPESVPELSGTGFATPVPAAASPSPNSDPLGKSITPDGSAKAGKANTKGQTKKTPAKAPAK